jgi:hypothetical protein
MPLARAEGEKAGGLLGGAPAASLGMHAGTC